MPHSLICIYKLGDVGYLGNLIGALSPDNGQYPPPGKWEFALSSNGRRGVNSRFAVVIEEDILQILLLFSDVLCCHRVCICFAYR